MRLEIIVILAFTFGIGALSGAIWWERALRRPDKGDAWAALLVGAAMSVALAVILLNPVDPIMDPVDWYMRETASVLARAAAHAGGLP